jgi:hypothetical protein
VHVRTRARYKVGRDNNQLVVVVPTTVQCIDRPLQSDIQDWDDGVKSTAPQNCDWFPPWTERIDSQGYNRTVRVILLVRNVDNQNDTITAFDVIIKPDKKKLFLDRAVVEDCARPKLQLIRKKRRDNRFNMGSLGCSIEGV